MRKLRLMTESEARTLVALEELDKPKRNARGVAELLSLNYTYTLRCLTDIVHHGWIEKKRVGRQVFYMRPPKGILYVALSKAKGISIQDAVGTVNGRSKNGKRS